MIACLNTQMTVHCQQQPSRAKRTHAGAPHQQQELALLGFSHAPRLLQSDHTGRRRAGMGKSASPSGPAAERASMKTVNGRCNPTCVQPGAKRGLQLTPELFSEPRMHVLSQAAGEESYKVERGIPNPSPGRCGRDAHHKLGCSRITQEIRHDTCGYQARVTELIRDLHLCDCEWVKERDHVSVRGATKGQIGNTSCCMRTS